MTDPQPTSIEAVVADPVQDTPVPTPAPAEQERSQYSIALEQTLKGSVALGKDLIYGATRPPKALFTMESSYAAVKEYNDDKHVTLDNCVELTGKYFTEHTAKAVGLAGSVLFLAYELLANIGSIYNAFASHPYFTLSAFLGANFLNAGYKRAQRDQVAAEEALSEEQSTEDPTAIPKTTESVVDESFNPDQLKFDF